MLCRSRPRLNTLNFGRSIRPCEWEAILHVWLKQTTKCQPPHSEKRISGLRKGLLIWPEVVFNEKGCHQFDGHQHMKDHCR